ncbi:MAG: dockerin type I domain-containing protein [Candidatus Bathyarchaeia archaeon]
MKTVKIRLLFMIFMTLVSLLAASIIIKTTHAQTNPVYLSMELVATPPLQDLDASANVLETPSTPTPIGQNFTVEIHLRGATVSNIPNGLFAVEVNFNFSNILSYAIPTDFTNYLGQPGGVLNPPLFTGTTYGDFYNSSGGGVVGYEGLGITDVGGWNAADGLVATITFHIIKQPQGSRGEPTVHLSLECVSDLVTLIQTYGGGIGPIRTMDWVALSVIHGAVQGSLTIDALDKTVVVIGQTANVTVLVANYGSFDATFNVTAYANATSIASENVTLVSGASTVITFSWNTYGNVYGNYYVNASAYPVLGGTNMANITWQDPWIIVTGKGDINGDFKVGLSDLSMLAKAYNSTPDRPNWNPNADLNDDGKVSLSDLSILAKSYNQHYP